MVDDTNFQVGKHSLLEAIDSGDRVSGYTHGFYRYPARSSPLFVREVIRQYSTSDDCILDPFMGGGTTIVEALTMGAEQLVSTLTPWLIL